MLRRIEGYLLIPHELLHVIGYWLVGKQCRYRLGDPYVTPVGSMSRKERLVGLLFPFVSCVVTWLALLPLPFVALFVLGLEWAVSLSVIICIPLGYAFTSIGDLRRAYQVIFNKPQGSSTPLDFFFWPIMEEHRQGIHNSSLIVLVGLILAYLYFLFFF